MTLLGEQSMMNETIRRVAENNRQLLSLLDWESQVDSREIIQNFNDLFSFHLFPEHNRLVGQSPANGSPRSSIRSNHSSKPATPPPTSANPANRNGTIILDSLNVSPKAKVKELENNNSSKIVNKNNSNASKMQQQMLQQLVDQQTLEKQKQMVEMLHANKGVEALGVLVQYLVFNVSTKFKQFTLLGCSWRSFMNVALNYNLKCKR